MTNWSSQERRLRERKADLVSEILNIEDRLDDEPSKDWEDRATERQGDEVLESLGLQDALELRQIDAALARVASGTYGQCTKCGNTISSERLTVLPATPLCRSCAAGGS